MKIKNVAFYKRCIQLVLFLAILSTLGNTSRTNVFAQTVANPLLIEFQYQLTPLKNDVHVKNQATMQTQAEGSLSSNEVCTEVGKPSGETPCNKTVSNQKLVKAGEDIFKAFETCIPGRAIDVYANKINAARDCLYTNLVGKGYKVDKVKAILEHAFNNAHSNGCYQCVAFVEEALSLIEEKSYIYYWQTGSHPWVKVPEGYELVPNGEAKPGDIFTYGVYPGEVGHVGIVKEIKSKVSFVALEANAADRNHVNGYYGTCDISNDRVITYTPGDISGQNKQPRFLRKIGANADASAIAEKLRAELQVDMQGFDETHLEWAYEILNSTPKKLLTLANTNNSLGSLIVIKKKDYTGPSDPDPFSYSYGCGQLAKDHGANIALIQDDEGNKQADIFKLTLVHEIAHMVQFCPATNAKDYYMKDQHEKVISGEGYVSHYAQNANTGQCPNNVSNINEDYADMIAYYLNPNTLQKNVCKLPSRLPNPYQNDGKPQHKALAEKILE